MVKVLDVVGGVASLDVDGDGVAESDSALGNAGISPEELTYRYVHDALGSVRLVVNASTGAVAQRMDYDAWGMVEKDTSPGFQPFGYAGGLYDVDTGLVRFGARDYDATTGTWLSREPLAANPEFVLERAREGRSVAAYAYASNSPTGLLDPDGLADRTEQCASLRKTLDNIDAEISKRIGELDEDPLDLPERCPGDKEKPSLSRWGHRMLVTKLKARRAAVQGLIAAYCTDWDPPPPPPPGATAVTTAAVILAIILLSPIGI